MTLLRIVLTPLFLILLFSSNSVLRQWSIVVFIATAFTDWYDGWLARRWGYVSRWGAFFDPLADKVVTSAALIAFQILGLIPGWTAWTIVIRDIVITVLRTYAEYKGNPVDTSKLAKTKTFGQFVVIYYILFFYIGQGMPALNDRFGPFIRSMLDHTLVYGLMVVITFITLWTGITYIIDNWRIIRELYGPVHQNTESK